MPKILEIKTICKAYPGSDQGVTDISLTLAEGERLSVLGASGSGKTTLLRLLAGLENPDSGDIRFNGQTLLNIPAHKRNFGMMFQDFALFPHMNVSDNIAFGLKMKKWDAVSIEQRMNEMLTLTRLQGYENRDVDELSGGEQQRVALARTLASKPDLLLLDEPLSALDRHLREQLMHELIDIIHRLDLTTVFVTHDHEEAFQLGNSIIVMDHGRIVQHGKPLDLLENPVNGRVKEFFKHHGRKK